MEVRGNPQYIGLAAAFGEGPQFGAAAIHLVAGYEVQPDAVISTSARMSMASCPLVRKTRSGGSPMISDFTGSAMCPAGIHGRAVISACPVPSRTSDKNTVVIPFATLAAHPR
jgi:hypothetical protein